MVGKGGASGPHSSKDLCLHDDVFTGARSTVFLYLRTAPPLPANSPPLSLRRLRVTPRGRRRLRAAPPAELSLVSPGDPVAGLRRAVAEDHEPQPPSDLRGLGPPRRGQRDAGQGEACAWGGAWGTLTGPAPRGDPRAWPEPRGGDLPGSAGL